MTPRLFTAIVVSYYAFVRGALPSGSSEAARNILSVLLATPAFIAAALGRGITSENIRRTSMTTFYGLWIVVLTSVVAVLLFIFDVDRFESLIFPIQILGLTQRLNIVWTCLALLSIATYLTLRKEKSDHRKYYLQILKKSAIAPRGS